MTIELRVSDTDTDLEGRLRKLAERENISLEEAALRLLRTATGSQPSPPREQPIGHALDEFMGDWSQEEAEEFLRAVEVFEQIDPSLWQ